MPEFYMIFARKKITKFPNFAWYLPENGRILRDICQKLPEFFMKFARKYVSPKLGGGKGHVPPCPRGPVIYAYGDEIPHRTDEWLALTHRTLTYPNHRRRSLSPIHTADADETKLSNRVASAVWTHPSAVVTQFAISCAVNWQVTT